MKLQLNLNTLFGALILAGVIWLLKTTNATASDVSVMKYAQATQERDLLDLRGRMIIAEIQLAKIQGREITIPK